MEMMILMIFEDDNGDCDNGGDYDTGCNDSGGHGVIMIGNYIVKQCGDNEIV